MNSETSLYIKKYYAFFEKRGYNLIENKPLLNDDPTLLFINSTIALFKEDMVNEKDIYKSAHVQDCFRTNSDANSLIYFRMLGIVDGVENLKVSFGDFIQFLTAECGVPIESINAVIHKDDFEFQKHWLEIGRKENMHVVDGDTDKFSTRWKYGDMYEISGKGLTIVYNHPGISACSDTCDVHCSCRKYTQIGNIIVIKKEPDGREYLDFGFGLERVLSYKYNGDIFKISDFYFHIEKIMNLGYKYDKAKAIFNLSRGVFKLIWEGVLPGNKKGGYILKSLIRKMTNEIAGENISELDKAVEIYKKIFNILEGTSREYLVENSEFVVKEMERYVLNIEKGMILAKKIINKNTAAEKNFIINKIRDTLGLPEFVIKELVN